MLRTSEEAQAHNKEVEAREIAWLKTGPDRVFLYVRMPKPRYEVLDPIGHTLGTFEDKAAAENHRLAQPRPSLCRIDKRQQLTGTTITTWPGTVVSSRCIIGLSVLVGGIAGRYARKRSIDCTIFGVRYVGWYYETAGDYCRLRKSKRQ